LQNIQEKLKAPKNQFNSFGKYNYRNCEDILEGVKPLIRENGCVLIIKDEIQVIGERYYVKATVKLIDVETKEEVISEALAREEESKKGMDGSQVTGASSSYARKYALNGLFAIDDTKDSDTTNITEKQPFKAKSTSQNPNVINDNQIKRLYAIANGRNDLAKEIIAKYGYTSSKEILTKDYDAIIKDLETIA
jgi:hypothetical protein